MPSSNNDDLIEFLRAKFDNLSLFVAMLLMSGMLIHFAHLASDKSEFLQPLQWAETTFTTVLGAYIGLTQAARYALSKTGGNGNGTTATTTDIHSTTTANSLGK